MWCLHGDEFIHIGVSWVVQGDRAPCCLNVALLHISLKTSLVQFSYCWHLHSLNRNMPFYICFWSSSCGMMVIHHYIQASAKVVTLAFSVSFFSYSNDDVSWVCRKDLCIHRDPNRSGHIITGSSWKLWYFIVR